VVALLKPTGFAGRLALFFILRRKSLSQQLLSLFKLQIRADSMRIPAEAKRRVIALRTVEQAMSSTAR
jgi:hypothetical protein